MKFITKYRKQIAAFLILVMAFQCVTPTVAYGLTSGPTQPEMQGFEPVSNTDMVDLFTGDFSYNIPLVDVGGYPVNLAYHSGTGMDDEASWVGNGWNVNVGSINRQLRGLPDDFNGSDKLERELSVKDHITKGGRFSASLDLLGIPVWKVKKKKKKKKLDLAITLSAGVQVDNYRGVGVDIGANAGISLADYVAGEYTRSIEDSSTGKSLGLPSIGLSLSSFDGAGVSLNQNILLKHISKNDKEYGLSKSIGFGYNSRMGLTGMTLGTSFDVKKDAMSFKGIEKKITDRQSGSNSFISFNSPTYIPTVDHASRNTSFTLSFNAGAELFFAYLGLGITGFYSKQQVAESIKRVPAFGYLNSEKGVDQSDALMDFNREKDVPYNNEIKYLPILIPTYDLFTASSQDGGGQYRLYRGSSGVFFDQRSVNSSNEFTVGFEAGAGQWFDAGADLYYQNIQTVTQKWRNRNNFLLKGDFQKQSVLTPLYEPAYFKRIGEPVPYDKDYVSKIKGTLPAAVYLPKKISNAISGAEASDQLRTSASPDGESTPVLKRDKREVRNTTFSYLTAKEASNHALDKTIKDYHPDSLVLNNCNSGGIKNTFSRVGDYRKAGHFSEITITGDDGKRSVYGIPVYNTYQEEVSFSIGENLSLRNKGLINYSNGVDNSTGNSNGLEHYYSKEKTPPYATSFLLTAILSADYVDRTGDGVTDDDLGTAVKFNYTKLDNLYNWRTPFAFGQDTANYNEGFLSDPRDDKASYVYGQKEIWYLHSIESKTMVAQFVLADRQDGLGVLDSRGAVDTLHKLKYLKEIRLYSKSDLRMNNNNPALTVPIKVVHFEYDYSICRGLPNSTGGGGKLTLKKVYFTFGVNQKGRLNPYEFSYDTSYNHYDYRQYDRWGVYKNAGDNPNGLNNAEFPYTLQDTSLTNKYASAWQLNEIITPSGENIHITYESDDYAWVQDRRASQMCMLQGVNTQGSSSGLIGADYIYVNLPYAVSSRSEMLERYFEGIDNLYYKFLIDLDNSGHKEFVPGYAKIIGTPDLIGSNIAKIQVEKKSGVNTMAKAGWQFLRMSLPKYAYPGSDNYIDDGTDLKKAIKALVTAFGTIKELIYGFDKRAQHRGYSDNVDLSKSWVRLCAPTWKKLGGGSRVKKIEVSDEWATMSGATGAKTATYTQIFDYTTTDAKGRTISSGVASYEPLLGNDENPFRQPVRYKQNQFLGLDNYFYIEEPFGESFFPAASVGYSIVTVKAIGSGDDETVNRTGVTVNEFYTAKEFPTKVSITSLQQCKPGTGKLFKLLSNQSVDNIGLSQGYSIELNDMHGKPKSMKIFNKSGQTISSIEYFYQTENELAEKKTLNNNVKMIGSDGIVSDGAIGTDVEMFTDMRQQTTDNLGVSVRVSGGSGSILIFPLPFFFPGIGVNYDRRSYRASSTVKIIHRFAIQNKIRKMDNGSSITTENLLWDAETGNVLLTKTQNEFDDPVYSFAYPAHWVYDRMGQAYQNLGTIFSGFSTNSNGEVTNAVYNSVLVPGDELIDVNTSDKYWVINSPVSGTYKNRLINESGILQQVNGLTLKLLRSGRRNMAGTAIATITSLNSPIAGDRLDISQLTKILDAKATVFSEEWSVPVIQNCGQPVCPEGCIISGDSTYCYHAYEHYPQPPVSSDFDSVCSRGNAVYSSLGSYIYSYGHYNTNGTYIDTPAGIYSNPFWVNSLGNSTDGPMNRCAVWRCGADTPVLKWVGFTTRFRVPATHHYYIGIGGDNQVEITVDGTTIVSQDQNAISSQSGIWGGSIDRTFKIWHIFEVPLDSGWRTIELKGWNNDDGQVAGFGAEIYDNTASQIMNATSYDSLKVVFTTRDFRNQHFSSGTYTNWYCDPGFTLDSTDGVYMCRDTQICQVNFGTNAIINPYYTGILGNWRPESHNVYQVSRENISGSLPVFGSTKIRTSGAYSVFNPFWQYNYSSIVWQSNPGNDARWITAGEITGFNSKGIEVENKDALNRYSSALFGYLESIPVAVAANAQYREIAYDGFEDYGFSLDCGGYDTCNTGHFNFRKYINGSSVQITNAYAHSGKSSLKLTSGVILKKTVYMGTPGSLYGFDNGRYTLQSNELAKGFSPIAGKKYVLSFWVKDGSPRDATTTMQAIVNGTNLVSSATKWPVVEGWKRIEVPFIIPSAASSFSLQLQPASGTIYIDDIRIHPFDGEMKTFAYDPSSQRLWAELDENNFATFYEYDDEGILIRVKKETERGIMTIRESRSSYRKR